MSNQYIDSLEELHDYEEIFNFAENIIHNNFDFDGLTIVVHQKREEKFIILTKDLQWRDINTLPPSMIKEIFYTKKAQIINQPDVYDNFNKTLDCFDEENISSLMLYPIVDKEEDISMVFSFWRKFEKEKEQVLEPLIVGSQRMGVTTRVKNKIIHKNFEDEHLEFIKSIDEVLLNVVKKLLEQIEIQKQSVLNEIENNQEVFKTPQEIITTLINIIIGTNSSIHNLKDILIQIKRGVHHNDKIFPHLITMQEILDTLDQNLINTFNFSSTNDIIQGLFKNKTDVNTKEFFEYFANFSHDILCQKHISLNLFLNPSLPSKISIEQQNTYIFLTKLLNFSFDDANANQYFNINISRDENQPICIFRITYNKSGVDAQRYRNIFLNNKDILDDSLYLSYKKFAQTGGKVSIGIDTDKQKVSFSVKIPYEVQDESSLVSGIYNSNIKVGILLDKQLDFYNANNIAKYLIALGLNKGQIKASEKIDLFDSDLTHIIIFQSKLSDELFDLLKEKDLHTMVVANGCLDDDNVLFYDYSKVDIEIDKNKLYLYELKEFIQSQSE